MVVTKRASEGSETTIGFRHTGATCVDIALVNIMPDAALEAT